MSAELRKSFFRCVSIIAICVALNCVGGYFSRKVGSILFLDLIGTAIASLTYGPVHGALVGYLSNAINEYFGIQFYFLFAPVHAASAAAWGILPRLLRGRYCSDFFNDGKEAMAANGPPYGYAHLLFGFLWVSFVSNLLASAAIAFTLTIYPNDLSCAAAIKTASTTTDPEMVLCEAARQLFSATDYNFEWPFLKITLAKALFGWPDHLIALAVAVLLVATTLKGRRYRMGGVFGLTLVTQRQQLAIVFAAIFVGLSLYQISFAQHRGGDSAAFWQLFMLAAYTNLLLLLFLNSRYEFDAFKPDYDDHMEKYEFPGINPDLERAFEDGLKLMTMFSILLVWILNQRCPAGGACKPSSDLFRDRVTGFLGVVVIIAFVGYVSLVVARSKRSLDAKPP